MTLTAQRRDRRAFLQQAGKGVGAGLLFGLIPWEDVLARAHRFGIVPGTRVDAAGRPVDALRGLDPFVGELNFFGFDYNPRDFLFCSGQLLAISQNTALFSLLGTTFGGNGSTTFALPDLRGRMMRGVGAGPGLSTVDLGEMVGSETVTLTTNDLPSHLHTGMPVATGRRTRTPSATSGASAVTDIPAYGTATDGSAATTTLTGSGTPVNNMPPFLALNLCIATAGVFPARP